MSAARDAAQPDGVPAPCTKKDEIAMSATSRSDAGVLAGSTPASAATAGRAAIAPTPLWERRAFYRYGFMALILAVWEMTGPFVNPIFFTYPSKIAVAFVELTASGELPHFLAQSLEVMCYGLLAAIAVGIPLGVATARIRRLDWALDLPLNALYATPMVALVPLLVLWFGIYLKAKIIVVLLFAVFPIVINTYQGVRECDKGLLEVARSYRSSEWLIWRDVLFPFALPYITAGVRLAIGRGLVGMVIAEFYTTITGLGFMITRYANVFEMDKTFVPVIVLMMLGVTLTSLLKWLERRIAPWSNANRQ
jgi:NitT/TauT family transport system permease protein